MMKVLTNLVAVLLTLTALCWTANANLSDRARDAFNTATAGGANDVADWYLGGMRGVWYGFYRGFFHEKRQPDPRCLNDHVKDELTDVMQFLAYGELSDIFQVADSATSLYFDNKDHCGQYEIAVAVKSRCIGGFCKFTNLLNNLFVKNLVETMGDFSVLADSLMKLQIKGVNAAQLYEQTLNIGKHAGSIVASVIDIHGEVPVASPFKAE